MKCVRITIIMKMGLAVVAIITMNTVTSAGMGTAMSRNTSTAMTKRAAAAKFILMKGMNTMNVAAGLSTTTNMVMLNVAVGMSTITNMVMLNVAVGMSTITVTTFRVTRRTVSVKSAIRMKNTATCAAKALKTVPAACQTLTV